MNIPRLKLINIFFKLKNYFAAEVEGLSVAYSHHPESTTKQDCTQQITNFRYDLALTNKL